MKITLTVELPVDFTPKEVERWKADMRTIAGYYVQEVVKDRAESLRKIVQQSVEFE